MSSPTTTILKVIASLFLAIVVVFSSTGFSINYHVCQGKVKSVAINSQAKNCSDSGDMMASCTQELKSNSSQENIKKKPCCEDRTIVHEIADERAMDEFVFSNSISALVLAEHVLEIADIFETFLLVQEPKTPPITRGIKTHILHQTFLI